jgi:hypothetical protein
VLAFAACASAQTTPQGAMIEKASQALSSADGAQQRSSGLPGWGGEEGVAVAKASGDLKLVCEPVDSIVWLDGVPVGSCQDFAGRPKGLWLGTKMRKVEVKREGYLPFETYIEPDGTRAKLFVTLAPSTVGGAP